MQGLFKYLRPEMGRDAISDCAKNLKDMKRISMTYPPKTEQLQASVINLKA